LYALVGENHADLDRRFRRLRERSLPGVLDGISLADWREGRLVGTVDEVRAQIGRWEDLGVSSLIVSLGSVPFSFASDDDIELVAAACSLDER
jgi:hypothetical protein